MFICRYLFHYSDLTIYFIKIKFVILVFYVFPIAMLFICFGFPDLLTLISTRVRITLPLHGVAKTFKFRHRSFGVLPLEK